MLGDKSAAYYDVCEHFGVRHTRAKRTHQNSAYLKIAYDEIIFVRC